MGDELLEVMCSKGISKFIQIKNGISHYTRIAQTNDIIIILKDNIPIQMDGEGWFETKGIIHFYLFNKMYAIVGNKKPRGIKPLQ